MFYYYYFDGICNSLVSTKRKKEKKRRTSQLILLRPALPDTKYSQGYYKKVKLQTNIPHENKCKYSNYNFSQLNTTIYEMDNRP